MTIENRSCKYDKGMVCFYTEECIYSSLPSCLQQNLYLAHKEIALMKERRNLKHSQISLKWRDNAFYYKKRCRGLEKWIKDKGMEVPTTQELFTKSEVEDERVRSSNSEATRIPRGDTEGSQNGTGSNLNGGQRIQPTPTG